MKICILQGAFLPVPPECGGAVEKMWFLLGQKFAIRGHDVTHISRLWRHFPAEEIINNVQHFRVAGYDTPAKLLILKIFDALYTIRAIFKIPKDADVIVTNTFWAPILVPLFKQGKVYVDVGRMPKGQMRFYRAAARLRANSTPVVKAICAELPASAAKRVSLIPNPLTYDLTEAGDLSLKKHFILYCGRIHPEKGLELLEKTVHALPDSWTLLIVGPWQVSAGGGGDAYLSSLKEKLTNSKVQFVEPVYDIEKLNRYYKEATIFVYPSVAEYGETFGLAPLEAMAWGAVPVVSDLSCFKDFIVNEMNGLIFNHRLHDAGEQLMRCILLLIQDEHLRNLLAENAKKVRVTHSADSIADLFLEDFKKILA